MYKCEKCGKEVYEKYGSGRFCCRSCANSTCRYIDGTWSTYNAQYKCPFCSKAYVTQTKLDNHILQKHRDLRKAKVAHTELDITNKELEEYKRLHPVCEICGKPETKTFMRQGKQIVTNNLCIDHNHKTNKFRGLLCSKCNRFLGGLEQLDFNAIIKYLNKER